MVQPDQQHWYGFADGSLPLTRWAIRQSQTGQVLAVYAECSLAGWDTVSEDFSGRFVDCFCQSITLPPSQVASSLGNAARTAFARTLAQFEPEVPAWASAQYVAACVQAEGLYLSWIGDLHGVCWRTGAGRVASNRPHAWEHRTPDGKTMRMVEKCLRLGDSDRDSGIPETLGPFPLDGPSILFLGPVDPDMFPFDPEGRSLWRKLLDSVSAAELGKSCKALESRLATTRKSNPPGSRFLGIIGSI